ncbi:MAG: hypothetical protein ACYDCK_12670 [Thermoplasmatota archaeon]
MAVAVAFLVVGFYCGASQVTASINSTPMGRPTCISAVSVFAIPGIVLSCAAWLSVLFRKWFAALALGGVLLGVGIIAVTSVGPYWGVAGLFDIAAATVLRPRASPRAGTGK